ncbi:hypothetical protein HOY80DRAFT_1135357 [Tuber brumale]|nr:hypothetical protein HOY80DRAFT_1135357 [Tuber brumale]
MECPQTPDAKAISERLRHVIMNDRPSLQNMYGKTEEELNISLQVPIQRGREMATKLVMEMGCSYAIAVDLTVLTLYDVAILIDDSCSMIHVEDGKRKDTLIEYIDHITDIYKLANQSGIFAMRFMNSGGGKKNWTGQSRQYLDQHSYGGVTRIGTELQKKILKKFVIGNPNQSKPLLVLIVTDGTVEGERRGHLQKVIRNCVEERDGAGKGLEAVTFQFSRIGSDLGAAQLLKKLDQDPVIGSYIDVLPVEFDLKQQMEDKWFVLPKILLGAILPDWDVQDYYDFTRPNGDLVNKESIDSDSGDDWDD